MRAKVLTDPARRRDLATIHVARKALGMEEDAYRAMLWSVARVKSAGDLDHAGRQAVLEHLKKCGFQRTRSPARDPQSKKILAGWLELKDLGALNDPSNRALERFVENTVGVKKLAWLSSDQASTVIEHLKAWARRVRKALPKDFA